MLALSGCSAPEAMGGGGRGGVIPEAAGGATHTTGEGSGGGGGLPLTGAGGSGGLTPISTGGGGAETTSTGGYGGFAAGGSGGSGGSVATSPSVAEFQVFIIRNINGQYHLDQDDVFAILEDMVLIRDLVLDWSDQQLELDLQFQIIDQLSLPSYTGGFIYPWTIESQLAPFVSDDTDFVYAVSKATGGGGTYGADYGVGGAGYSWSAGGKGCTENSSLSYGGVPVCEPLMHEWMHQLDWALHSINGVTDIYQGLASTIDWGQWDHGQWPACGTGDPDPQQWFPSVDLCEWDPDWQDCNNQQSAGTCLHAAQWYEHVIREHYPRGIQFIGNLNRVPSP